MRMSGLTLNRSRQAPAEDTPAFGSIAERFRRAGDLDRAISLCQEGLRKFPGQLSARVTLGWALLDKGMYDEAQAELEQVLRRAPDNLAAIRGLAELHDRAESAVPTMEQAGRWQQAEPATPRHARAEEPAARAVAVPSIAKPEPAPMSVKPEPMPVLPRPEAVPVFVQPKAVPAFAQAEAASVFAQVDAAVFAQAEAVPVFVQPQPAPVFAEPTAAPMVAQAVDLPVDLSAQLADQATVADTAQVWVTDEPLQLETAAQAAVEHASRHFAQELAIEPEFQPDATPAFDVDPALSLAGIANAESVEESFVLDATVGAEPEVVQETLASEELAEVLAELDFDSEVIGATSPDPVGALAALGALDEPDASTLDLVSGELAVAAALDAIAAEEVPSVPLNLFAETLDQELHPVVVPHVDDRAIDLPTAVELIDMPAATDQRIQVAAFDRMDDEPAAEMRSPLAGLERFLHKVEMRRMQLSESMA